MIGEMKKIEYEESSQSICGRNITLSPIDDYEYVVVSSGDVGGHCSVNFGLNISSTCACQICMRKVDFDADVMNITFTGESEKVRLAHDVVHKKI